MSRIQRKSLWRKYFGIFIVVAAYWVISIVTVFVNKSLLSSSSVKLNAPLFVTWFQCLVSTIVCLFMSLFSRIFPTLMRFPEGSPLDVHSLQKVLPLSVLFAAMIATNNLCLKYVGVSFYYVGRSLTTVFNVLLTYFLLGQKTSLRCVACCAFIVFGFWLGVDQERLTDEFSWKGVIYGILGSLALSMYSIYTKKVLPHVGQEIWLLSYFNNFYSIILFLPLMLVSGEISEVVHYENLFEQWFWFAMVIGGLCGFSIGFATAMQIKVTSPLTHNISGTAKACAQTVIATKWYKEAKTLLWWTSNVVVLFGSATYARIKQLEMEKEYKNPILLQKI